MGSRSELYENPSSPELWVGAVINPWFLGGMVSWTVSTMVWVYILSGNQLSFAYGLYGLNYVLTPLAGRVLFHEALQPTQLVGMGLITLGVGLTIVGRASP